VVKIAIIGDIHRHFNARDVTIFNRSEYDLILITGDLVDFRSKEALPVADQLAQLQTPALFIAGNHDCTNLVQFLAEVKGISSLAQLSSAGQDKRVARLQRHLGAVTFAAYSCHDFMFNNQDFSIIAARPFSLGGPEMGFRPYLYRKYGVNSLQDSVRRLQKLIDGSVNDTLIFLAHNGPSGLGSRKDDIWGCDFRDEGGDHGDPDLYEAIRYAKDQGKRVTAVVAGHMHHRLMDGGQRQWLVQEEGITYINAARVPRIFKRGEETVHHHLAMTLEDGQVIVEEVLLF
jgi:uncharacterized protein (TIGR04168 family)